MILRLKKHQENLLARNSFQHSQKSQLNKVILIDAWYNKSFWLYILAPLTFVFSVFSKARRNSYIKNPKKVWDSPKPIIVVGNISMGGTGKTPLVKFIANELAKRGFKPGLVSRGYGGKYSGTLEVTPETTYKQTEMRLKF